MKHFDLIAKRIKYSLLERDELQAKKNQIQNDTMKQKNLSKELYSQKDEFTDQINNEKQEL